MRIYTRYQAARRRPHWHTALQFALAAAGLGLVGWVLYRAGVGQPEPVTLSPPSPARPPLVAPAQTPATHPARQLVSPLASPPARVPTNTGPVAPGIPLPATESGTPPSVPTYPPRPVEDTFEAQVALAARGISSGAIDGAPGYQTRAALRAFQRASGLPVTGALDPATRLRLMLAAPPFATYVVQPADLARLLPVSPTWLGKSRQPRLDFSSVLELVAEQHRAHPALVRKLNPGVDWNRVAPGLALQVPAVPPPEIRGRVAFIRIGLQDRVLSGYDPRTNLLLHFPCSIGARLEKRPVGRLVIVSTVLDPTYTFNPAVFPESAEARRLGRKLTLPPGPNSPVGVAWIGLDRPGYGIHGTPRPEDVGRTESHGCFRLANWDAALLARLVSPGLPVYVGP